MPSQSMISDSPDLLMAQVRIFSFFPFSSAKIRENVGIIVREVQKSHENAVKRVENDSSEVHVVHQSKATVYGRGLDSWPFSREKSWCTRSDPDRQP